MHDSIISFDRTQHLNWTKQLAIYIDRAQATSMQLQSMHATHTLHIHETSDRARTHKLNFCDEQQNKACQRRRRRRRRRHQPRQRHRSRCPSSRRRRRRHPCRRRRRRRGPATTTTGSMPRPTLPLPVVSFIVFNFQSQHQLQYPGRSICCCYRYRYRHRHSAAATTQADQAPSSSPPAPGPAGGRRVRVPDVRAAVPDVPGAGRPPDQPPQAAGGDQEAAAVIKGGAGPRVRHVWAGLLHGAGPWWAHEEAPSGPGWQRGFWWCGPYADHRAWKAHLRFLLPAASQPVRVVFKRYIKKCSCSVSGTSVRYVQKKKGY